MNDMPTADAERGLPESPHTVTGSERDPVRDAREPRGSEPDPCDDFRDPGEPPVLDWIDKSVIDIDAAYQRELDEARVERILTWFAWSSFGAIVVAPTADGRYNCTDGQHRLEAAKRHPAVEFVPAVIIQITGTEAEAQNFVAINRDRKNVNALQLLHAGIAAGDPDALTVKQVCERAGVTLLRYPGRSYKPGETVAVVAIRSLIDKFGALRARQILDVLAAAKLAPITGGQIAAAALLMTDPEYRDEVDPEALSEAITGRAALLDSEASAFATTHCTTKTKALAAVWFKRMRKRRRMVA